MLAIIVFMPYWLKGGMIALNGYGHPMVLFIGWLTIRNVTGGLMTNVPEDYIQKRKDIAKYLRSRGVSRTVIWGIIWRGWVVGRSMKLLMTDWHVREFMVWRAMHEKDYQDQLFQEERKKGI